MERCPKPSCCSITCIIHSSHPFVFDTIRRVLSSDADLRECVKPYSTVLKQLSKENPHVLIVDTCSVKYWPELFQEWQSEGGYTISLLSLDAQSKGEELKMLDMGVGGIVALTDERLSQLPKAVRAVAGGKLWVRRETLERYVRETKGLLTRMPLHAAEPLTVREQQVTEFLRQGLSNRQIAGVIGISERTAKFHVSNILIKYRIGNRKKLRVRQTGLSFASLNSPPDEPSVAVPNQGLLPYPSPSTGR
jgi:DNA-binding NarL/FixJ family response regulator